MKLTHEFEITVSRVNEGLHDEPYETFRAVSVSVDSEGNLRIGTKTGERLISATLWGGFEVKRQTTVHKEDQSRL